MSVPEKKLYDIVADFLEKEKNCDNVIVDKVSFEFDGLKRMRIDVVGANPPYIYAVEVKRGFNFDLLSAALMQASNYRTACTDVYIAFPIVAFENEREELKNYARKQCENLGIGLLLIGDNKVREEVKPNRDLAKQFLDYEKYYNVFKQLVGVLERNTRIRLLRALGSLTTFYYLIKSLSLIHI